MWYHQLTGLWVVFGPCVHKELWSKVRTASSCSVVRAIVFTRQQLHCPLAAGLFGQLLPQQGGEIQFWMLPSVPEISSGINHLPCLRRLACHPIPNLSLYVSPSPWCVLVAHWEVGLSPHLCSQPVLLFQHSFTETSALRFANLALPLFSRACSAPHPHLCCC
jgi:hypothetical protein